MAEKPKPAEKPISLHPKRFEKAVKDLLAVKPEREHHRKQEAQSKKK